LVDGSIHIPAKKKKSKIFLFDYINNNRGHGFRKSVSPVRFIVRPLPGQPKPVI
jgi:hypothetical protein